MKRYWVVGLLMTICCGLNFAPARQAQSERRTLDIFYVDVEGGAATLIVTPAGESILVDAGWPGFEGRDAKRIEKAMQAAGIREIDHMVTTHYHTDHYGGVPELARRVRINRFYDHGPTSSLDEDKDFAAKYAAYQVAARGQSITLNPGGNIRLKKAAGTPPVYLQCLAARAEITTGKQMAGGPNPECSNARPEAEDRSDNARSVVLLMRYGGFDFLDTGDLTWNIEQKLVCPQNLFGEIDLYQVAHHGMNISNNPALLRSARPTVAIMNNGPRKGGHPDTVKWLRELPSLKDLYQLHRNVASGPDQNVAPEFIANLEENQDNADMIRVSVDAAKRSFTVTNDRTGISHSYQIK